MLKYILNGFLAKKNKINFFIFFIQILNIKFNNIYTLYTKNQFKNQF